MGENAEAMENLSGIILAKSIELLEKASLCDRCLGRFFARLGFSLTNKVRGESLKTLLCMKSSILIERGAEEEGLRILSLLARTGFKPAVEHLAKLGIEPPTITPCEVCRGILDNELRVLVDKALEMLSSYEYTTFLVGCKVPGAIVEKEDSLRSLVGVEWSESIKREINREAGTIIASKTGKNASFQNPDLLVVLNFHDMSVDVKSSPIFIYGRYRKLVRGIPQSKWICPKCRGLGCEECGGSGKKYPTSVEELVTEPILQAFRGVKAKFHGAGREDIDVRVLGPGRPFVVEVVEPRVRSVDLEELQEVMNDRSRGLVEVEGLTYTDRSMIGLLKLSAKVKEKTYYAVVKASSPVPLDKLKELEAFFSGTTIRQRTPIRVLHRRADKLRLKKVYEVKVEPLDSDKFKALIRCQGGLYIKELVNGDNGRTTPSFQEYLGVDLQVLELDVIDVQE
ncbi:MAG: tRNA pseudouridine(54/55) synthase Pus10 [Thermoprotei archaeon]|nr:MAG: tRNA pseudouridine(54/55) synthase Pus10 [Thermoprotei archaeon]RLF22703.1 MAG: tRNA pseudouridine(54/55) synthase Pus10 [Thermoprotei archaeon]